MATVSPVKPKSLKMLQDVLRESAESDARMENDREEFEVWREPVLLPNLKRKRRSSSQSTSSETEQTAASGSQRHRMLQDLCEQKPYQARTPPSKRPNLNHLNRKAQDSPLQQHRGSSVNSLELSPLSNHTPQSSRGK